MERDLADGVADLAAQVAAVHFDELEGRQVSHPQERRQLGLARVVGELTRDLE